MARIKSKVPPRGTLQSDYRRALSGCVVAHAGYLAVQGEKNVPGRRLLQQKSLWQAMEARKNAIHELLLRQAKQD